MSNMSYCRFENTYNDLKDCVEALNENGLKELSDQENIYAKKIKDLCKEYSQSLENARKAKFYRTNRDIFLRYFESLEQYEALILAGKFGKIEEIIEEGK